MDLQGVYFLLHLDRDLYLLLHLILLGVHSVLLAHFHFHLLLKYNQKQNYWLMLLQLLMDKDCPL